MIKKLSLIISIVLLLVGGLFVALHYQIDKPLNITQPTILNVPAGETMNSLSQKVQQNKWVENRVWLRTFVRLNPEYSAIKAGTYQLMPGDSVETLLEKLISGKEYQFSVTLIEGLTLKQWIELLRNTQGIKATASTESVAALVKALKLERENPEGLFLAETYAFTQGTRDITILRRALNAMSELLVNEWQQRAENLPYKNAYQALTMASIIEKETGQRAEQATIAGVFVNRLHKNMRLQTDPTIIYGLGDEYQGDIKRKHIKQYTPYNTYRIKGLPPTPIAMPGAEAIKAALHPELHDLYYFVSKGNGWHQFSATLAEHNAAVRKYQLGK